MNRLIPGPGGERPSPKRWKNVNAGHQGLQDMGKGPAPIAYLFNPNVKAGSAMLVPTQPGSRLQEENYWQMRTRKLDEQSASIEGKIFKGCTIFFNGRTGGMSAHHLGIMVQENGGRVSRAPGGSTTHIVAENLNGSKTDKAIKAWGRIRVVHPDWILRSLEAKRQLPDASFRVVRSQQHTVKSFFPGKPAGKS